METQVAFRNCAPFVRCITKIDGTTDAEDLHFAMLMYNFRECTSNYSDMAGSFSFYSKYEATNFDNVIVNVIVNTDDLKSLKCKIKLIGNTVAQPAPNAVNVILENTTIAVPLKYLSNFWRSLKMLVINCKVELELKLTKDCV